jgi:hypothetical protein
MLVVIANRPSTPRPCGQQLISYIITSRLNGDEGNARSYSKAAIDTPVHVVNDWYLTPSEQFSSHIMAKAGYIWWDEEEDLTRSVQYQHI